MGVRVKRTFASVIAVILLVSAALMGCSSNNATENSNDPGTDTNAPAEQKTDPLNISVFYGFSGQVPTENNKISKKIKDELGVTLKEEYLVGDSEQKLGVMIAGGEYPDLITANTKLVAAGAVIPLEDLIEQHAPNLKKHYEPYWNKMKDPSDGHIYWLPNYGVYTGEFNMTWYAGPAFWIQKAVLKEFGYPKPKTLEEYFDLIKKYKEKYPEIDGQPTIGFTTLAYDWKKFPLFNPPEHLAGFPNDGGVIVKNNVAEIFAHKDIAKTYYKKLNEINAQGLMDKEAFTQNYDQYLAKIATGRVLGMFDQHWNFGQGEDSLIAQEKIERTYVGLPLVYDGVKDWYLDRPPINLNNGFGITVDAKDPVRIIKFLDSLLDEKWQKLMQWGVEGEDYLVGDDGMFYRTPEMRKQQEDPAWKLENKMAGFFGTSPKLEGTFSDGNATSPGSQPKEYFDGLKELDKEVLNAYGYKFWTDFFSEPPENPVYYPAWQIDLIEGSDAKLAATKMEELQVKYYPKAILSKPEQFDSIWDEFVNEAGKINIKAIEDRYNEQIQWRIENWSN
ncbi:ABC transporter substrate-binding protein [Paenibacillus alkalitolerans]|uniref:ABC transporter substrate-binding protein n=1 Tax=Paenibacillus alkalitolerans TaxID=2799335 RepID=UPI0018F2E237|nr:ABC transporter substrate-binding protein [Paenibacillus alkalitolerans]